MYAPPNTGKTLMLLKLLSDSIVEGRIAAKNLFYVNCDDNVRGLEEKNEIAEEFNFHMLADGWRGFSISEFNSEFEKLISDPDANSKIIVLDTTKKFVDLMSKKDCRDFSEILRRFVMVGGTAIEVAHTNKNRSQSGDLIHAGTTDLIEDADAGYILDSATGPNNSNEKIVTFKNIKKRGNNVNKASYSYSTQTGITYRELFDSVQPVDEGSANKAKIAGRKEADAEIVDVIKTCITEGINGKMALTEAVSNRSGASKRSVGHCLDRYAGTDIQEHFWKISIGGRGKMTYELLERPDQARCS